MHHSHTPTLSYEAHSGLWRGLKYLLLAATGILAVVEHSPTLFILLAVAIGLVLAFTQRVEKLDRQTQANSPGCSGA